MSATKEKNVNRRNYKLPLYRLHSLIEIRDELKGYKIMYYKEYVGGRKAETGSELENLCERFG